MVTGPGTEACDIALLLSKLVALSDEISEDELQLADVAVDANVGLPDQELVVIGLGVPPRDDDASDEQLFSESLIMECVAIMKSSATGPPTDGLPLKIFDLVWTWTYLSVVTIKR